MYVCMYVIAIMYLAIYREVGGVRERELGIKHRSSFLQGTHFTKPSP